MRFDYPTLSNDRYQIQQCIGFGGMAAVFKCYDTSLQTYRAIKVLRPELVVRKSIRERFTTEAIAMARVNHPNIVHVYDHGIEGMTLFIVMEYLPHGSLQEYLDKKGPLSRFQAVSVCLDVALALEKAHELEIIHRDIKPDNILLSPQGCKITDFGIARIELESRSVTRTQAVMGTLPYMSPEQRLSAKKTNHQSDIYALAATLFVLLTGKDPTDLYDEDEQDKLLVDVDDGMVQIIKKGCHIKMSHRYATIGDMIRDLKNISLSQEQNQEQILLLDSPNPTEPKTTNFEELLHIWGEYTGSQMDTVEATNEKVKENSNTKPNISTETLHIEDMLLDDVQTPEFIETTVSPNQQVQPIQETIYMDDTTSVQKPVSPESQSNTSTNKMIFSVFFVSFISFGFAVFIVLSQKQDTSTPQITISQDKEISSPEWDYEGIYLLSKPSSQEDQTQFKKARTAFLNGDFLLSEQLLLPIKKQYSQDPVVHNLSFLLLESRGQHALADVASESASKNSRKTSTHLGSMITLSHQSLRKSFNTSLMLQKWDKIRNKHKDPMVEVNYLISSRSLLERDFYKEVQNSRSKHPDWSILANIEIVALHMIGNDRETLKVVEKTITQYPLDNRFKLERGKLLLRMGKLEAAEEVMKQVLMTEPNFSEAHGVLAGIYASQNNEANRLSEFMIGLSDETPSISQIQLLQTQAEQLANLGRLQEAKKVWVFCINEAQKKEVEYRALECASAQLQASFWLEDSSLWEGEYTKVQNLISNPNLDITIRNLYQLQILKIKVQQYIQSGETAEAQLIFKQLQQSNTEEFPRDVYASTLTQIQQDLWLATRNTSALQKQQTVLETQQLLSTESCTNSFLRYRIAQVLKDDLRSKKSLRSIVQHDCSPNRELEGIMLAQSQLFLLQILKKTKDKEEGRTVLSDFYSSWSHADDDLKLTTEIRILQKYFGFVQK